MSTPTLTADQLRTCSDGVIAYQGIIDRNKIATEYNNEQIKLAQAAREVWLARRDALAAKHTRWAQSTDEYAEFKDRERQEVFWSKECWGRPAGCSGDITPSDQNCRDEAYSKNLPYHAGWAATGNIQGCGDMSFWNGCAGNPKYQTFECKRTQASIENAVRNYKSAEPQPFSEIEPKPDVGPYAFQVLEDVGGNMNCCYNTLNIAKGDATNVIQQCNQKIETLAKEAGVTLPPPPEPITEPPLVIPPVSGDQDTGEIDNNVTIIAIIILIIVIIISSLTLIAVV